jgi:hypothetical protein
MMEPHSPVRIAAAELAVGISLTTQDWQLGVTQRQHAPLRRLATWLQHPAPERCAMQLHFNALPAAGDVDHSNQRTRPLAAWPYAQEIGAGPKANIRQGTIATQSEEMRSARPDNLVNRPPQAGEGSIRLHDRGIYFPV